MKNIDKLNAGHIDNKQINQHALQIFKDSSSFFSHQEYRELMLKISAKANYNTHLAEDCLSEAILKLLKWEADPNKEAIRTPFQWVLVTAKNLVYEHYRKNAYEKRRNEKMIGTHQNFSLNDGEKKIINKTSKKFLTDKIENVCTPKEKEVYKAMEGTEDLKSLAEKLDTSYSNAKQHAQNIKNKLLPKKG